MDLLFVGSGVCRVTKGPGHVGTDGLLEALACAEPCFDEEFGVLRDAVMQGSDELSACVCVLLVWDEERRRLVEALRALDIRVLVLLVTPEAAGAGDGDVVHVKPGRVGERLAGLAAGARGPDLVRARVP